MLLFTMVVKLASKEGIVRRTVLTASGVIKRVLIVP